MEKNLAKYLIRFKNSLKYRDFILDLFSKSEIKSLEANNVNLDSKTIVSVPDGFFVYPGKLFLLSGSLYFISEVDEKTNISKFEKADFKLNQPLLNPSDKMTIASKDIENCTASSLETTVGRFLANQVLLVDNFGNSIPYVNEQWNVRKIERIIAKKAIDDEVNINQIKSYLNSIYYLSGFVELFTPGFSKKSLTTSKEVKKRKKELIEKYKDKLDDPNVMLKIQNELIALDKKYLKGDESMKFLGISSRSFDVHRKKMFLLHGMVEAFGDDTKDFNFVKSNLDEGWSKEDMAALFNDVRKGIYDRAVNTAKGGTETKYLGRMFQESKIIMDDCKSKNGIPVLLTKDNIEKFYYRNIIVDGKTILLTESNASKFINKNVLLRSFLYCRAKNGYCFACADQRFKKINLKILNLLPIKISSSFLTQSMKSMHGKSIDSHTLTSFDKFLI